MFGNKVLKFSLVVLSFIALPSCQHSIPNNLKPITEVKSAQLVEQKKIIVITVHLAQLNSEPSLVAVELGHNQNLYALPQPIFTQADMQEVTPVIAQDGKTFVMFDLCPKAREKLESVSRQAKGHFFLMSINGQLIDVSKISEPLTQGKLLISTKNQNHSREIIQLLR